MRAEPAPQALQLVTEGTRRGSFLKAMMGSRSRSSSCNGRIPLSGNLALPCFDDDQAGMARPPLLGNCPPGTPVTILPHHHPLAAPFGGQSTRHARNPTLRLPDRPNADTDYANSPAVAAEAPGLATVPSWDYASADALEGMFLNSLGRFYSNNKFSLQLTLLDQPPGGSDTHTGKTYIVSKGASDTTPPFIALVTSHNRVSVLRDAYGGNNFRVQTADNPLAAQFVALLYANSDLTYTQLQRVADDFDISLPPLLVEDDDIIVHNKKNRTALSKIKAPKSSIHHHPRRNPLPCTGGAFAFSEGLTGANWPQLPLASSWSKPVRPSREHKMGGPVYLFSCVFFREFPLETPRGVGLYLRTAPE